MVVRKWPVVPICSNQLLDVNPDDLLENGLYRLCDVYKGGGGYDRFPVIFERRFGYTINAVQFVVQLYGCPLSCSYCYVTKSGVFGKPIYKSTEELITSFDKAFVSVFHLMGGAPALYLENWKEIASLPPVFHSDFLLIEKEYELEWLENLPGLHVVSLKDFPVNYDLLWRNFDCLVEAGVNFYVTFTGEPILKEAVFRRYGKRVLEDSFVVPIIHYKSLGWRKVI